MTDRNEFRRPIMRLVTAVLDDRIDGDPTLRQIADDLLAQIEPLIRADERERIAQAIERLMVSPNAGDDYRIGWVRLRGIAARIARRGGADE